MLASFAVSNLTGVSDPGYMAALAGASRRGETLGRELRAERDLAVELGRRRQRRRPEGRAAPLDIVRGDHQRSGGTGFGWRKVGEG